MQGGISLITGEGIYYALYSAKTLSEDFNNYKINMKRVIKHLKKEKLAKRFIYNYRIRNFILDRYNNKIFNKIINIFLKKILN